METAKNLSVQKYLPPTISTQILGQNIQGKVTAPVAPGSNSAAAGSKREGKAPRRRS